jgi:hypothetical protein
MTLKITKKQNVILDGMKYVAKEYVDCNQCAFTKIGLCGEIPCMPHRRHDEQEVHFVFKGPVKPKNKWIAINGVIPGLAPNLRIEFKNKLGTVSSLTVKILDWAIGRDCEVTHYRAVS